MYVQITHSERCTIPQRIACALKDGPSFFETHPTCLSTKKAACSLRNWRSSTSHQSTLCLQTLKCQIKHNLMQAACLLYNWRASTSHQPTLCLQTRECQIKHNLMSAIWDQDKMIPTQEGYSLRSRAVALRTGPSSV